VNRIDIEREELMGLLERARPALSEADYGKLKAALETLSHLTDLLADKETTIRQLRQLLLGFSHFPRTTEKTKDVLEKAAAEAGGAETSEAAPSEGAPSEPEPTAEASTPVAGHGRNGAAAYRGAKKVVVAHGELKHGDPCPECPQGKVYVQQEPAQLVRIVGRAPLEATVYELERLRCHLCGQVFTAPEPDGIGPEKYDETAAAMVAQLKYGSGVPFSRLENLEKRMGIPLPVTTQWEVVEEAAELLKPAGEELIRQAAQGEVVHNDDTGMRVLKLERPPGDERTGVFTSGIVSVGGGRRIAMFFTGRQHAGENLADVLRHRAAELAPPVQMCDALSRNEPDLGPGVQLLLANCLAHGRRQFVDVAGSFPGECRYVLETLGQVYANDAEARRRGLAQVERLAYHQQHSGPRMDELEQWFQQQFAERKTEPNSGLGKAIIYFQRHWKGLTAFLREPGAPLDNNLCERALKRAVLHRKNALFYRTMRGAEVGDLFMSLIHTCELNGVNSFDYLVESQRHAAELAATPAAWMPWNYRETLAPLARAPTA
jgi:transposase